MFIKRSTLNRLLTYVEENQKSTNQLVDSVKDLVSACIAQQNCMIEMNEKVNAILDQVSAQTNINVDQIDMGDNGAEEEEAAE